MLEISSLLAALALQPGAVYRHTDGGLYRFHLVARHTDNQAPLVVYEHIWPFEAGQVWARPAHEWASRFKVLTPVQVEQEMAQDRQVAQQRITAAKQARKALASKSA